jgi:hypothetical protein
VTVDLYTFERNSKHSLVELDGPAHIGNGYFKVGHWVRRHGVSRAVTSTSSFIASSNKPETIIVAAGFAMARYFLNTGQHGSKSSLLGKM